MSFPQPQEEFCPSQLRTAMAFHGGSLPLPAAYPKEKKSLHQDFRKAQLTAQVLSVLGYFTTGKQGSSC